MAMRTTTNRGWRATTVSRLSAVCALTGAALLTAVTGGQAWADGGASATPVPKAPAAAADTGSGAAVKDQAPSPVPLTATPAPAQPSAAPKESKRPADHPSAVPSAGRDAGSGAGATPVPAAPAKPEAAKPDAPTGTTPQVRDVPKGAAQAGDGSGADDSSGLKLAGGGAVAAIGAGALGFAVLRRRSGARG
ncbi:hypothetical protein ACFP3U_22275 [Kitasatospora misakiensis]|uniref:Tat pathway signal sequence domain protein n=1 Tax=Kitasatospora misakiensis TaxID=67330 RepID=A0ABW0XAX8_9ACTN